MYTYTLIMIIHLVIWGTAIIITPKEFFVLWIGFIITLLFTIIMYFVERNNQY